MQIHLINLVKSSTLQYEYEQLFKKFTFSSSDKDLLHQRITSTILHHLYSKSSMIKDYT